MENEIIELEEKLRVAMLNSDVLTLNELISDSLCFVAPDGNIATKQMDLNIHKNNIQKMTELNPYDQVININGDTAVVTVKMDIKGTYGTFDISGSYRYLRVWKKTDKIDKNWQIIAGSVTKIQ